MKQLKQLAVIIMIFAFTVQISAFASIDEVTQDTQSADGWNIISANSDSMGMIDISQKFQGKSSLKLVNNTSQANSNMFLKAIAKVPVTKGKTYKYGFKAKAQKANRVFTMIDYSNRYTLTPFGDTYDWTNFEFSYTHLTDGEIVEMSIVLDSKTPAFWIDSVFFCEVGSEENLISNGTFENGGSVTETNTDEKNIPIFSIENVKIDGDLTEWEKIKPFEIKNYQKFVEGVEADLKANIRYAFDDENFYFALETIDDINFPVAGNLYWQGDGVQCVVSDIDEGFGVELGFAYNAQNDTLEKFGSKTTLANAKKDGNKITYEIAIPWTVRFNGKVPTSFLFNALINDNDKNGRNYCLEIAPGISMYKNNSDFPELYPMNIEKESGIGSWFEGQKTITSGNEYSYYLNLYNQSDKEQIIDISIKNIGINKKINLKSQSSKKETFKVEFDDFGEKEIVVDITANGKTHSVTYPLIVNLGESNFDEFYGKLMSYKNELQNLIYQCNKSNIPTDYEMINYAVIERFMQFAKDDKANNDYSRMLEYDKSLTKLYNESKESLSRYLSGEEKSKTVPHYITGDIEKDGVGLIGTTDDGNKTSKMPVFFVGYGHWQQVREEVTKFPAMGANIIQAEIGPNSVVFPKMIAESWNKNTSGNSQVELSIFKENAKNGECSLKLSNNIPYSHNSFSYVMQSVLVKPNTTYVYGLSANAKTVKNTWFCINGVDPTGKMRKSLDGTYPWKDYSFEYTTNKNEKILNFTVLCEDITPELLIDDVFVKEKNTETNLVKNSGFENGEGVVSESGYSVNYSEIEKLETTLKEAEQNNMLVSLNLAPHYFTNFVTAEDATINENNKFHQFLPYNLDHPKVREILELHIRTVMSRVKNYKSLFDVCITNEPQFTTSRSEYYVPFWQTYIKKLYSNDINALNNSYKSNYKSFEDVIMPTVASKTQLYYDWYNFNDEVVADFHNWMAKIVKEEAPNVMVHSKIMQYFDVTGNSRLDIGTNYELWAKNLDLNGNDAWSFLNSPTTTLQAKLGWFDLQTSIKNMPVWNTEDHIIPDSPKMNYDEKHPTHVTADLWQGAIHGRAGSIIWIWDRLENYMPTGKQNIFSNSNMTLRPMSVAKIGATTLDLNRLSNEITAIQKEKPKVGVLYSRTALCYSDEHMSSIYDVYQNLLYNGQKVGFITDTQPEKMQDYETVIIPSATNINETMMTQIKKFSEMGKKILIFGENSISKNEYDVKRDIDEILNSKNTKVAKKSEIATEVTNLIQELKLDDVVLVDYETNEKIDKTEWSYSQNNGEYIINICNYEWGKPKKIKILIDGKEVQKFTELRSGTQYNSTITVNPFEPLLLEIIAN